MGYIVIMVNKIIVSIPIIAVTDMESTSSWTPKSLNSENVDKSLPNATMIIESTTNAMNSIKNDCTNEYAKISLRRAPSWTRIA